MTTKTTEKKQTTVTREAIAGIVRAAFEEYRMAVSRGLAYPPTDHIVDGVVDEIVERTTRDLDYLLYEALVAKGKHAAWAAMVKVVADTHRPSSYALDFYYYDRETLEQKRPRVFGWAVRSTGTWLHIPGTGRDSCLVLAEAAFKTEEHDWYWWDGQTLSALSGAACLARLRAEERSLSIATKETDGV